jgi:hypothetical protein
VPAGVTARPHASREMLLLPREHGAWSQLLVPLACALALGRPGPAAWLLAVAALLAFVAHEPLLVLLGLRGARVRAEHGARAGRWLAALGAGAAVAGVLGLLLAPRVARLGAIVPLALAAGVGWLVARRAEKTVAGEIAVAAALAAAASVVALAAGVAPRAALAATLAWTLLAAAATLAVHVILVRARSKGARDPGPVHATGAALLGLAAVALAGAGMPWALPVAVAPAVLLSIGMSLVPPSPRRLRQLGWTLVGASLWALAVLVAGLR